MCSVRPRLRGPPRPPPATGRLLPDRAPWLRMQLVRNCPGDRGLGTSVGPRRGSSRTAFSSALLAKIWRNALDLLRFRITIRPVRNGALALIRMTVSPTVSYPSTVWIVGNGRSTSISDPAARGARESLTLSRNGPPRRPWTSIDGLVTAVARPGIASRSSGTQKLLATLSR